MKTLLKKITAFCLVAFVISSCQSDRSGFASRKYTNFDNRQASIDIKKPGINKKKDAVVVTTNTNDPTEVKKDKQFQNNTTASTNNEVIIIENETKELAKSIAKSNETVVEENYESKVKEAKRTTSIKAKPIKKRGPRTDELLLIILAIIIPPVAVYMVDGIGSSFWVNIILCLLCGLPGIIHALIVVSRGGSGGGGRGSDQRRSGAN